MNLQTTVCNTYRIANVLDLAPQLVCPPASVGEKSLGYTSGYTVVKQSPDRSGMASFIRVRSRRGVIYDRACLIAYVRPFTNVTGTDGTSLN